MTPSFHVQFSFSNIAGLIPGANSMATSRPLMTPSSTTNCADRAGVHAQQRVPQVFPDCQHSAQIVSRHERERSRFSVTCDPLVCEDLHNAGVHIRDRREGDLHRFLEAETGDQKLYVCDDHASFPFEDLWGSLSTPGDKLPQRSIDTTRICCLLLKSFPWTTVREKGKKWMIYSSSDTSIWEPFTRAFCGNAYFKAFSGYFAYFI